MSLKERIKQDLEKALKSKDELRLSVLRMLSSALHNREIEKRAKTGDEVLTDEEQIAVLRSEVKKRKDAMAEFEKGGRGDLVEKETAELKILEKYLPPELGDEDIERIVREVKGNLGEITPRDFGRVMAEVMKRVRGQAGGDRVSAIVKHMLGV